MQDVTETQSISLHFFANQQQMINIKNNKTVMS